MNEARLRELERAAAFLKTTKPRRCRCAGTCKRCREYREQRAKISPDTVLELVHTIRHDRWGTPIPGKVT